MQSLIIFFIIFIFSLGQVSLSGGIFAPGIFPDLLLVLSIFWVSYFGIERKIGWIMLAGFFLDLATGGPVGKNIFLLVLAACATSYLSLKLLMSGESGKFFLTLILIAIGTLVNELVGRLLTLVMLNDGFKWTFFLGGEIFLKIFSNLLFFMLIYFPIIKLEKVFSIQKEDIKL